MKLDVDPFPVNTIGFEEKTILVCSDLARTTKGKNVGVSVDLKNKMLKPRSLRGWSLERECATEASSEKEAKFGYVDRQVPKTATKADA
jgi:hypothetical protein